MPRWLPWLVDLRTPVSRMQYAAVGFGLMGLKYAVDALAIHALIGKAWTPLDYLSPLAAPRLEWIDQHQGAALALAAWTLPFVWIGVSMTMRRAVDANLSPWLALAFFVPVLNYLVMLAFCLVPSRSPLESAIIQGVDREEEARFRVLPILAGLAAGAPTFLLGAYALNEYGLALFAGTPFVMGCVSGFVYGREGGGRFGGSLLVPGVTVLAGAGLLLLFALEGVVCIVMALPLALVLAAIGGVLGHMLSERSHSTVAPALVALFGLPGLAGIESALTEPAEFAIVTTVDVDAPPERVWPHVVAFTEIPPPTELLFRAGIACPMRARIDGRGVGAVRHCEFTTGAFVEPITVWDEPRRLAFDVTEQPDPMRELHPWAHIRPPHLENGWRSLRGEFLLEPLPGGRTRVVGTTWCELRYAPVLYWRPWAEHIVHAIHLRVLEHVRALAEAG